MRKGCAIGVLAAAALMPGRSAEAHQTGGHPHHQLTSSWINGCRVILGHVTSDTDFKIASAYTQDQGTSCQTVGARVRGQSEIHYGGSHIYYWSGWDFDNNSAWVNLDLNNGQPNYVSSWVVYESQHYRWHDGPGSAETYTYSK